MTYAGETHKCLEWKANSLRTFGSESAQGATAESVGRRPRRKSWMRLGGGGGNSGQIR